MKIIRSHQNATIKRLSALRQHRRRRAAERVLVDGARETRRAIETGWPLLGFYEPIDSADQVLPPAPQFVDDVAFIRRWAASRKMHHGVAASPMRKLSYGQQSSFGVAEFASLSRTVVDLPACDDGLVLVLDRIEKPGNLGAVFRTADAAGVAAICLSDCLTDAMNSNAIRSSLGAVFTVPFAEGTANEIAIWLQRRGGPVMALRVEGAIDLFEQDLRGKATVVLGSESDGLANRWQ
ncbi:MAG: RNA methyltransferase, partial [Planctomycetota bacterium]